MTLLSYSIAIRTLGTAGDKFRRELESIAAQTIQPEKVVVYIAEGYERPGFTVGKEEYVWVRKGMVAQRALRYDEIGSNAILMVDDDVLLAPDSAEKMLKAMADHNADCIGADVFQNHRMPFKVKLYAALTNLVLPHRSDRWAFKVHHNVSFSYNWNPEPRCYQSQSCGGPAMLWRKEAFLKLGVEDELWLDALEFAYGDDQLVTYKLHLNTGKLGVLYDAGITHLDAQSSSAGFKKSAAYIYTRTKASYMIWYRSIYRNGRDTVCSRVISAAAFCLKSLWLAFVMSGVSVVKFDVHVISSYFKGLRDGRKTVRTDGFKSLRPYCLPIE